MKKKTFGIQQTFSDQVREIVRSIRKGKVMTYGEVAKLAGSPGAARAVGVVMKHNYDPTVHCHRVVGSNGHVCDYNRGGKAMKIEMLKKEGIRFTSSGRVIL
jgi:methylated-DNA-[protein]-cysteine S-methyltransferase